MRLISITFLVLILTACGHGSRTADNQTNEVEESAGTITSLVKLIATPDKFHGRPITVTGFMNVEFEGNVIYIHKEDYENGLYPNGLWINLTDAQEKEIDSLNLNKNYVLIEGTFNADGHGHLGLWSGEIDKIERISNWGGSTPPIRTIIKFLPPKVSADK